MIRITATPTDSNIVLSVPEKYIGKKVQVLMFDVEEVTLEYTLKSPKLKLSQLRGFLSADTAEAIQQHLQQSGKEWDSL